MVLLKGAVSKNLSTRLSEDLLYWKGLLWRMVSRTQLMAKEPGGASVWLGPGWRPALLRPGSEHLPGDVVSLWNCSLRGIPCDDSSYISLCTETESLFSL